MLFIPCPPLYILYNSLVRIVLRLYIIPGVRNFPVSEAIPRIGPPYPLYKRNHV